MSKASKKKRDEITKEQQPRIILRTPFMFNDPILKDTRPAGWYPKQPKEKDEQSTEE